MCVYIYDISGCELPGQGDAASQAQEHQGNVWPWVTTAAQSSGDVRGAVRWRWTPLQEHLRASPSPAPAPADEMKARAISELEIPPVAPGLT